ncbi:T9SS C-terminal target domain-containing protein [Dokdonia sinensis]|uniref:T9SS C-terminal target domain-containing protein n=1 Tax=Dokdonia sinensis TaxID=2479847 RepID=A0A3M0G9W1_9FLAO|nr:T9SS type A sorting domain-containing protein [Dokdonia sinensis]RMB61047.1 T9SS C-terminal target domain-containing protein [Dokdonia sinensis]
MKKITLLMALLTFGISNAQVTTGEVVFSAGYSAQLDIDDDGVTLTMIGPDNIWLGVGFGVTSMTNGGDVVTYDSTGFNDRRFTGVGATPPTDTQDWTLVSDDVSGGERTVVATRGLTGSDDTDYTFDPDDASIMLVWARSPSSLNFGAHGSNNRGSTVVGFNLGVDDALFAQNIKLFPNPASDIVNISFVHTSERAQVEIFSVLGQSIRSQELSANESIVDISDLEAGMYILQITSENGIASKRIIKE